MDKLKEAKQNSAVSTAAIQALVRAGREKFALDFPGNHQCFDAMTWDVRDLVERPVTQRYSLIYFTRYRTRDQALPPIYAEVIKSWIVLNRQSLSNMFFRSNIARLLWEAILLRRGDDPAVFSWQDFCEEDLSQTELLMRKHLSASNVYKSGTELLGMANFLALRSVCRQLYYTLQTPRTEAISQHTIAGREERTTKLPSKRALEGIADIYNTYAHDPADRLRVCALAVLVVTGFRLGELLTLPLKCEVSEVSDGKPRYGLRYFKEKVNGAEKILDVRWLTATGAELARKALIEIREITAPARERAKILEENPNRVPIPSYQWAETMSPDEVANALGLKNRFSVYRIPLEKLPRHQKSKAFFYLANEVEAYLLSKRVERLWTLDQKDGTYQKLSETLFVAFSRGFHVTRLANPSARHVNPLLVEPMTRAHLAMFLIGGQGNKSAFERFGIREENGAYCRLTSHQFRHWLNDLADKGGLSNDLQTRWMGRENPKDTPAYHHATVEEKLQWLKNGIRNGEILGTIASVYFALPEDERDIFLDGQIQAVHFTPLGLCVHDFAINPCPYYLNCVRGCSDYLRTKGNQQERINLIQVQRRTKQALEVVQTQAAAGNGKVAQVWIQHYEDTLAGVQAALAIDDDPLVGDGTTVHPFQDQVSLFQSL